MFGRHYAMAERSLVETREPGQEGMTPIDYATQLLAEIINRCEAVGYLLEVAEDGVGQTDAGLPVRTAFKLLRDDILGEARTRAIRAGLLDADGHLVLSAGRRMIDDDVPFALMTAAETPVRIRTQAELQAEEGTFDATRADGGHGARATHARDVRA